MSESVSIVLTDELLKIMYPALLSNTDNPLVYFLQEIIKASEMSLGDLAFACNFDRSLPYSWLKGKSKPSVTCLVNLCFVVGKKTEFLHDDKSGLLMNVEWWLQRALKIRGKEISEIDFRNIISKFHGESAMKAQILKDLIEEKKKIIFNLLFLNNIECPELQIASESNQKVWSQIIATHMVSEESSNYFSNSKAPNHMYFFGGEFVSFDALYEWLHVLVKAINLEQTITVFVPVKNTLQTEEFNFQKSLYQIYLKNLGPEVCARVKLFLSNTPVSCPLSMYCRDFGDGKLCFSELHGSEKVTQTLSVLFSTKGLKRVEINEKIFKLTTLKTDMSEGVAKTLLQANGIDSISLTPAGEEWILVEV